MNRYRLSLIAIILIAFGLRWHNLTYHSLWFDEAVSVHWARQSVPRILEVGFSLVEDRLPPLYYLLLKGWAGWVGFSEAGVRSLSVLTDTLLIPVSAAIARRLFNRRTTLLTALLVALNPFLIWYAQEARMYAQAVLFGAISVWAFLQMVIPGPEGSPQRSWGSTWRQTGATILFILAAIAALYSHLYAGFLLPALGLWLVISYPRAWRLWLRFALSGLVIALAFAPLALAIWRFSGEATPGDPFSGLGQRVWWLLQVFTVWKAPLPLSLQITIPAIIALFGLCAFIQLPMTNPQGKRYQLSTTHPLLLTTLLLVTPFLIATLLLFRNYLAFFGERYFIVMVPWLLLLAARGADNLIAFVEKFLTRTSPRTTHYTLHFTNPISIISTCLALLPLLTAALLPIPGQWSGSAAKEFWRQSVAYLAEHATAADGILIHPDWVRYPFQFYFEGPGQTYAAFSDVGPDTPLDGPLQGVVGNHPVIWLIQSHLDGPDPARRVEQWFANRYPLVTELYPPGISLKAYAPGYQLDRLPPTATPVDLQFANGLHLAGFEADSVASATDEFFHPPSGWVHLTLYWRASRPLDGEAVPYAHLVGPEGVWGVSLERAGDALRLYQPGQWPVESTEPGLVRQDVDINLNPATPPGVYDLVVGITGQSEQYRLSPVEIR